RPTVNPTPPFYTNPVWLTSSLLSRQIACCSSSSERNSARRMMRQALPIESIQLREARSLAQRRSRALIRGDGCGRFLCAFAFGLALLFDLFTAAAALAAFIGAAGAIGPLAVGNVPAAALEVN